MKARSVESEFRMSRTSKQPTVWPYAATAFAWTWGFWLPAVLSSGKVFESYTIWFFVIGGLGPAIAAIVMMFARHDREFIRDYWARVIDPRRIPGAWWLSVLILMPAIGCASIILNLATGGSSEAFVSLARFADSPFSLFTFIVVTLFFGPLPEELGWRGYALDRLQVGHSALSASAILGILWAFWHLPLFFIAGTYQREELILGSPMFWLWIVQLFMATVLMTWVHNNTGRSTLAAILFHFSINFTGEIMELSNRERYIMTAILIAVVAAVVVHSGPSKLQRAEP